MKPLSTPQQVPISVSAFMYVSGFNLPMVTPSIKLRVYAKDAGP